jgi:hypothetical protein
MLPTFATTWVLVGLATGREKHVVWVYAIEA